MLSVSLLFWLNPLARLLAPVAAILAVLYPLAKRITSWPQVVLGVAFNWGILMAFAAVTGTIPWVAWLFYAGSIAWTLAYDTFYAMVDRDDDLHLNIKSSAMSAGSWDLALIAAGEIIFLSVLLFLGYYYELSAYYYTGIILVFLMMTAQLIYARSRSRERCFKSFRQQQWLGALLWLIVVLAFYLN
jgi:4-hydroxybenzoate polyprenyltransferase